MFYRKKTNKNSDKLSKKVGTVLDRRELIKALSVTGFLAAGSGSVISQVLRTLSLPQGMLKEAETSFLLGQNLPYITEQIEEIGAPELITQDNTKVKNATSIAQKSKNFEEVYSDDYFLVPEKLEILKRSHEKLHQVQQFVGYANFNLMTIDEAFNLAKSRSQIEEFSPVEKTILEELFFTDAKKYGFFGERVLKTFTQKAITKKEVEKIPRTGHFLFKDIANESYERLLKDVGPSLVLTSGIRTLAKQTYLFATKALQSQGNLSKASRSVAPPGYSYHAVGDFDVGKVGFGYRNFTSAFAKTEEYRKIAKLEYVELRYTQENLFGVRYEPWHITSV